MWITPAVTPRSGAVFHNHKRSYTGTKSLWSGPRIAHRIASDRPPEETDNENRPHRPARQHPRDHIALRRHSARRGDERRWPEEGEREGPRPRLHAARGEPLRLQEG